MSDYRQQKPYSLRIPGDLKSTLEAFAATEHRSLHGEILLRLRQSVAQGGVIGCLPDDLQRSIKAAADQNRRSILDEIVARLTTTLTPPPETGTSPDLPNGGEDHLFAELAAVIDHYSKAHRLLLAYSDKHARLAAAQKGVGLLAPATAKGCADR